jgi:hypothetical protein
MVCRKEFVGYSEINLMSKSRRGLLAGAALLTAFCGTASAGPITINDTPFVPAKDAKTFQTIGGDANLYQTLNFNAAPADGTTSGGGVAVANVTSFKSPTDTTVAANLAQWSLYAVIDYTLAGDWTGITAKGAGDFTSTSLAGTVALYAVSGNCSFGFNPAQAGPSTIITSAGCTGSPVEIAAGNIDADSSFTLDAGKVNTNTQLETGTEAFDIDATLTSLDASVLTPTDEAIDLTIASGNGFGSNGTDKLVDAPSQYWCTNGGSGNCGSDNANWGADPPSAVPEPASVALFGAGLLAFAGRRRRQRG